MLIVETYVGESTIPGAGRGLFAAEDIPKGTLVTVVNEAVDQFRDDTYVRGMTPRELGAYAFHAYRINEDTGLWILNTDNEQFTNHSTDPNIARAGAEEVGIGDYHEEVAIRDIPKGHEIVSDYGQFDTAAFHKLNDMGLLGSLHVPQITNLTAGPDKWTFRHAPDSSRLDT